MGRPKIDFTVLIDAALLRWHKLDGGRDRRVLDLAILDTAKEPPNGFIREFDTLRKLLRRKLCKLGNDALRSALLAARQRAMPYLRYGTPQPALFLPIHDPATPNNGVFFGNPGAERAKLFWPIQEPTGMNYQLSYPEGSQPRLYRNNFWRSQLMDYLWRSSRQGHPQLLPIQEPATSTDKLFGSLWSRQHH
jgi:hypothetical protein